ncbi:hypothetical protein [Cytobacillus kochii]|nr:hypothetical protein [Cytobacillus kochii]
MNKEKMIWSKELGIYLLPKQPNKNDMVWDKELGIYKLSKGKK